MPTNLPAEAIKANTEFEEAKTTSEKIAKLDALIKAIPKHKGTEKLLSNLKIKMKKLRGQADYEKATRAARRSMNVKRDGAAQICLVGFPNSGKSFLLKKLTNISIDSTPVPFETKEPAVSMYNYKGVRLQLVEIPSTTGEMEAELLSVVRNCDIVLIVASEPGQAETIAEFLESSHIRLNRSKKKIKVIKRHRGGIIVSGSKNFTGDHEELKDILRSAGLHNADIMFYEKTVLQDVRDLLDESTVYRKALVFVNGAFRTKMVSISRSDSLMDAIWHSLGMMRVYTKEPGKGRTEEPMVVAESLSVGDVGRRIHKDFVRKFRFARVWGKSAKFDSQMVGLSHRLQEGDTVEFHLR